MLRRKLDIRTHDLITTPTGLNPYSIDVNIPIYLFPGVAED